MSSLTQLPLLDDTDFYFPLYLAKKYQQPLQHYFEDRVLWTSIMDWLTLLTGDRVKARKAWENFNEKFSTPYSKGSTGLIQENDYIGADGKTYPAFYGHELVLYDLAQNMRSVKSRPVIQEVKDFLRQAGFTISEMIRNPEKAAAQFRAMADGRKQEFTSMPADDLKKYRRLLASGYDMREADQWMQFDKLGRDAYKKASAEWYKRDGDIPKLVNMTTEIATGFSATDLKRQWDIKDSPRNYLSTIEKAVLGWVETVAATYHDVRNSHGTSQLSEDIQEVGSAIDPVKLKNLKGDRLKRPLPAPEQKKLLKPGDE